MLDAHISRMSAHKFSLAPITSCGRLMQLRGRSGNLVVAHNIAWLPTITRGLPRMTCGCPRVCVGSQFRGRPKLPETCESSRCLGDHIVREIMGIRGQMWTQCGCVWMPSLRVELDAFCGRLWTRNIACVWMSRFA